MSGSQGGSGIHYKPQNVQVVIRWTVILRWENHGSESLGHSVRRESSIRPDRPQGYPLERRDGLRADSTGDPCLALDVSTATESSRLWVIIHALQDLPKLTRGIVAQLSGRGRRPWPGLETTYSNISGA